MNFKFFRNENDYVLRLEPMQLLTLNRSRINNEYCFQFDDEEPYVFGSGNDPITFTINPTADGSITFQHNGRTFRIFTRERQ
jgi:hypothetical protein